MLSRLAFFGLIIAGLYAAFAAFVFYKQRALLFPATRFPGGVTASPLPPDAERLILDIPGGRSEAWLLPPATPATSPVPVVVFGHGNGELIEEWVPLFSLVRARGMGVLLVEYPGYGHASGAPSEDSIRAAMLAAYDGLLTRPWVDARRIVAYGRSLGGGAVMVLGRERPLAAVVLQSTFTSVRQFAHAFGVPEFLVRDPFDSLAAVRTFQGPVLVFHGTADPMIPFYNGQRLAAAAPAGRLVALACGHNDCPPDWTAFWNEVFRFWEQAGVLPRRP
jgi:fermentation-respiration switch protein FrsA (DUF1100 family)